MAGVTLLADVGKGFVIDAAKSLLGKITALIDEQIALAWGFKNDLEEFKEKFNVIQLMVGYAANNEGNIRNPVLEGWLNKVKGLIFLAEDLLDEYAYEMLRRKVITNHYHHPKGSERKRQKAKVRIAIFKSWSSNPVVFRFRMANKLKHLGVSWDDIIDQGNKLGIKPMEVAVAESTKTKAVEAEPDAIHIRRKHVDCESIVGRDMDRDVIINWLCESSNLSQRLSVIGIYGMAGLGKTTICKVAFEGDDVKMKFEPRIWVCVSHDFKFEILLKEIAEQVLGSGVSNNLSCEVVKREMKNKLEGKKYLLTLDDVWDTFTEIWEPLRSVLQEMGGSDGSTLLVTSRSRNVLETLCTYNSDGVGGMKEPRIYELGKLTDETSEKLFWQRVGVEGLSDPVKKEVAQSLLEKCDGVPLAIRTLGDMLRSQKHANDWVNIHKSEIWNEKDGVYPSVKLSFKYLSGLAVKRCFAFCGTFEEDEIIDKDRLIQLWMANGLLQSSGDDTMEQVGEQYFDELLRNSLFQEPMPVIVPLGKLTNCKMHDVVHKLACDILKHDSSCSSTLQTQYHLSMSVNDDDDDEVLRCSPQQGDSKVRMLILSGSCDRLDKKVRLVEFKNLRALSLVGLRLKELPDSIGTLKHLRYLDISYNSDLTSLPNELTKLHHLQTLRIFGCTKMVRFPREIYKLVNIRHLCCYSGFETIGMPEGLGMLSHLQTLPIIDLKKNWGGRLRELKSLNQLKGRIVLQNLQVANKEEAKEANLKFKENIESLELSWGDDEGESNSSREEDKTILDALQPYSNLKCLSLYGYKAKTLSDWVLGMKGSNSRSLSCLKYLIIQNCRHMTSLPDVRNLTCLEFLTLRDCCKVSTLEQLPSIFDLSKLRMLRLGPLSPELDTIFPPYPFSCPLSESLFELHLNGHKMDKVKSVPFQIQYLVSLRCLMIVGFPSVDEIPEWLSSLTSLQELHLWSLPTLKRLPSAHSMQQLTQLNKLAIRHCPILKKACVEGSGAQWPNIQHIPKITII